MVASQLAGGLFGPSSSFYHHLPYQTPLAPTGGKRLRGWLRLPLQIAEDLDQRPRHHYLVVCQCKQLFLNVSFTCEILHFLNEQSKFKYFRDQSLFLYREEVGRGEGGGGLEEGRPNFFKQLIGGHHFLGFARGLVCAFANGITFTK